MSISSVIAMTKVLRMTQRMSCFHVFGWVLRFWVRCSLRALSSVQYQSIRRSYAWFCRAYSSDPSFRKELQLLVSLAPTLYRPDSIHRSSCYAGPRFIFGQSANYLFRYCLLSSSTGTNFRNIRRFERACGVTSEFRSNIDMVRDRCTRDSWWRVRVGRFDGEYRARGYCCSACKRWDPEMHKG